MTFVMRTIKEREPASDWTMTPVSELPRWEGVRRVCLDVETHDEHLHTLGIGVRRGGYVVGISVALQWDLAADAKAFYLPIRHASGSNLPEVEVWKYLRDNALTFRGEVVGANLSYDLDYLWENKVDFPLIKFYRDVQVAEPLIYELERSYSLDTIAWKYLQVGKDEKSLERAAELLGLHPKKDLWRLPAKYVGPYAEQDTLLPLKILEKQEKVIGDQDLWKIYDLESRVLPVLVKMRRRGVRVDFKKLEDVENDTLHQEAEALAEVKHLTGVSIQVGDVWEPEAIIKALQHVNFPLDKKTPKGAISLDVHVLEAFPDPVAKAIVRARRVNKIRTTFAASVRRFECKGRIHTTFNQLRYQADDGGLGGAAYGRLSSVDPNLQQQPARDEEWGPKWRGIYVPEEGRKWLCCDYSAQEPRWAVYYGSLIGAPGAAELVAKYEANHAMDLHQQTADLAGIKRKEAKTIFLGLCYGMGGAKLCRSLGFEPRVATPRELGWSGRGKPNGWMDKKMEVAGPEGQSFLDKFNQLVPFVKTLARAAQNRAEKQGYVVTAGGRRCRFNPIFGGHHKALNRIVQGSSADQTKSALVKMDEAGIQVQLQVHDEIDFSCLDDVEMNKAIRIMKEVLPMGRVPCMVDAEDGDSWGEATKVDPNRLQLRLGGPDEGRR